MTREDIDNIINAICPIDGDYEKPCISPKYLRQELEQLALDQRQWNEDPTSKNDLEVDCVSRQEVDRLVYRYLKEPTDNHVAFYEDFLDLQSVTPQGPKWIPVGERLPKPNANDGLTARYYLIQNEYEDMLVARYDGMGWEQIYQHEYLEDDVIAWMPLPKAYREVEK